MVLCCELGANGQKMTDSGPMATDEPNRVGPRPHGRSRRAVLGFGCAGLYRLSKKRDRLAILHAAYELGIRHFDVAPIYGLGLAEAEIAEFRATRDDIQVATKFGIRPSAAGRLAGLVQPPIRRTLQRYPSIQRTIKASGGSPDSGAVGRILYSRQKYSVANTKRALNRCRRVLGTERIDYFLLHEPAAVFADNWLPLVEYLESERASGGIGHWGPAGDLSHASSSLVELISHATVLQFPYDLLSEYNAPRPDGTRVNITFGLISAALPRITAVLDRDPAFRRQCCALLNADLGDQSSLIHLLIRDALGRNPYGIVLLSSTNHIHLENICSAATDPLQNEADVASMIRQRFSDTAVER